MTIYMILLVVTLKWKFLLCIQDPIVSPPFELQTYLFLGNKSTSKGLSFATKLVIVALTVSLFKDDGSFLQQKQLAKKVEISKKSRNLEGQDSIFGSYNLDDCYEILTNGKTCRILGSSDAL